MNLYKPNWLFLFLIFLCLFSCAPKEEEVAVVDPDIPEIDWNIGQVTEETAFSGERSIVVGAQSPFGLTTTIDSVQGGDFYQVNLWAKISDHLFNLTAHSSWGTFYSNSYLEESDRAWKPIRLYFQVPDSVVNGSFKTYFHYYGKNVAYVDSLSVVRMKRQKIDRNLPDFLLLPLTNSLLSELNAHNLIATEDNFYKFVQKKKTDKVFTHYGVSRDAYLKSFRSTPDLFKQLKAYNERKAILTVGLGQQDLHKAIAGFTEEMVFSQGDSIHVKVINHLDQPYTATLFSLEPEYQRKTEFEKTLTGASFSVATDQLAVGAYGIQLKNKEGEFDIPILLTQQETQQTVILAPVTTWHAYNDFDGKSFYRNYLDSSSVYFVSTQRPMSAVRFDSTFLGHDFYVFDNIVDYFKSKGGTSIYPDYYLEKYPRLFRNAKTLVFAQHCEYFSPGMMKNLASFSNQKNIISLGANQAYYKISWHDDYSRIECRKNGTLHQNSILLGGTWRSPFTSEARIWGVAYTDAGYATYAPYEVVAPEHWLLEGLDLKVKAQFGVRGIDQRGLSGDEMDKMDASSPPNTVLIAKGLNPNNGGGDVVIIEKGRIATLSTGSIASGAGLGADPIFTKMMDNFLSKY